ncbi:Uncharacterized protein Fot_54532 [Forsythia ovata]|uniref:Uncharacterized protein n=1 Tax=Forsythia ovata TaxID=205694 RepID=A0ABD1P8V0_9LAMI
MANLLLDLKTRFLHQIRQDEENFATSELDCWRREPELLAYPINVLGCSVDITFPSSCNYCFSYKNYLKAKSRASGATHTTSSIIGVPSMHVNTISSIISSP